MATPRIEHKTPYKSIRRMLILHEMQVDDSIFFKNASSDSIRSEVYREKKIIGGNFRTRKERGGVRVFRIS